MRVLTPDVNKEKERIAKKKEEEKKKNIESTASTEKSNEEDEAAALPLWERSCRDIAYI